MSPKAKGRFIVLEGIDGSGLSTQAGRLAEWLHGQGLPAVLTKEPSEGVVGRLLRTVLSGQAPLDERSVALLFAADRRDHLATLIDPELTQGRHVVCDRYLLSSLAYQGATLDERWVEAINEGVPSPDLTLFVRVPAAEARARMDAVRPGVERYEEEKTLSRMLSRFDRLASGPLGKTHHVVTLDGCGTMSDVATAVQAAVRRLLCLPEV